MSKIEAFWKDATADDVARVMAGETVEARFRDSDTSDWSVNSCKLKGWTEGSWACNGGLRWVFCQVYREPSWYADKPDPGPGYRLLGKFPGEPVRGGDFIYRSDGVWVELVNECSPMQGPSLWYRRRIEPVEPEPKHYVLRVGDSVETPSGHRVQVVSRSETQRFYALTAGDKITTTNGQTITITAKGFEVTQ
jgi:hypothetical protein